MDTGPLIRREADYLNELTENRKRLFNSLFYFTRRLNIKYSCIKVKKRECSDEIMLNSRISKQIGNILDDNSGFFASFDNVIVYYDNGQINLTRIISSVFSSHLPNVEFRKVKPIDYRLFQVADMLCTMELLADKAETNSFSNSELGFFDSIRNFKKIESRQWLISMVSAWRSSVSVTISSLERFHFLKQLLFLYLIQHIFCSFFENFLYIGSEYVKFFSLKKFYLTNPPVLLS